MAFVRYHIKHCFATLFTSIVTNDDDAYVATAILSRSTYGVIVDNYKKIISWGFTIISYIYNILKLISRKKGNLHGSKILTKGKRCDIL